MLAVRLHFMEIAQHCCTFHYDNWHHNVFVILGGKIKSQLYNNMNGIHVKQKKHFCFRNERHLWVNGNFIYSEYNNHNLNSSLLLAYGDAFVVKQMNATVTHGKGEKHRIRIHIHTRFILYVCHASVFIFVNIFEHSET